MKKFISALLLILLTLSCVACGSEEAPQATKPTLGNSDSYTDVTTGIGSAEENIDATTEPTEAPTEPEPDPIYFDIRGWQEDLFLGYVNNNGEGYYSAINSKGEKQFDLGDDQSFIGSIKEDEANAFFGEYALLEDNTVINRKGETVFDLANTDFEAVYYRECLDVGYLLCSKSVNTFEETGTHYFAVNVVDGNSYQFEGTMKPMSEGHYYYFGNGIFIYAKANSGFGTHHTFYNILTKQEYAGYKLNEAGEQVFEYLPDLYFFGGFKGTPETKPTTNGHFIVKDHESILDCDVATGLWTITPIHTILGVDRVSSDKDCTASYIHQMLYSGESYNSEKFLINALNGKYLLMNDYKSYDILHYVEGVGYLASVTNEGNGKFITVIKEDGTRAFDPIPLTAVKAYGPSLFIIMGENGNPALYNWNGQLVKEWETKLNHVTMGDTSVMIITFLDSELKTFLYTQDGTEIAIKEKVNNDDIDTTEILGFNAGCYVLENLLVAEDGNTYVTRVN